MATVAFDSARSRGMLRRDFLLAAGSACAGAQPASMPIIDTHIHLFDTSRPGGIPWPPKDNPILYRPALPARYRAIAEPLGIRGAIEVECSPAFDDNQWVLDIAAHDDFIVGTIGNLEPGKPDFAKQLERFHRNPLFRGIRYGNLWDRDLGREIAKPDFVTGLKHLSEAGLVLDTANPDPALIDAVLRVTDRVPNLRVVMDHLPQMTARSNVEELAKRPHVFVKMSQVLRRVDGRVPEDLPFYRAHLDEIFALFGEDRVLYGSDWPNSDQWGSYPTVLRLVREYFRTKPAAVADKYFWKNSLAVYRWVARSAAQHLI